MHAAEEQDWVLFANTFQSVPNKNLPGECLLQLTNLLQTTNFCSIDINSAISVKVQFLVLQYR